MKNLARILILICALVISLCAVSCGDKPTEPQKTYTIRFYDEGGALLHTATVNEGDTPSYSYEKPDTVEWDYTVLGWASVRGGDPLASIPAATADAAYYAAVKQEKQKYTVSFDSKGGSSVTSQTILYGEECIVPTKPTYEGKVFVAWCSDAEAKTAVTFPLTVTENITLYAAWNDRIDVTSVLRALLDEDVPTPMSFIPEKMRPAARLIDPKNIPDYANNVSVSSMLSGGYGEQWHMILDNLAQSENFFSILTVLESVSSSAIATFQNHVDSNPNGAATHSFKAGIYSVSIDYTDKILTFVLDYTATLPIFGEQSVQIALTLNETTGEKTGRIQAGDANALTYTSSKDSYTFAIKYLGVRTALFEVKRDPSGMTIGHINEYLTISGKGLHSAADFYIGSDYISVVGNKASGFIGFTGFINELYDAKTGSLLGYEVKETLSSITYNTLWFDLKNISGIQSIRLQAAADEEGSATLHINGSTAALQTKLFGGLNLKSASRRFDIEFRKQYFYSYDAANNGYIEYELSVPMLFIQEEKLGDFSSDFKNANGVNASVTLSSTILSKIQNDYKNLIPKFEENKGSIKEDDIRRIIGEKIKIS